MKILSVHIENFGNISDKDFRFGDGLNSFERENGYGKTTLLSFVKAMLYGLSSYKSNTKEFTDREHYFPFGGGKFGGNMEFTAGGKEYRVERFFDGKSETKDSVKIFIDGKETEINDLGFHIFGLNADDFSRTAYIDGEIVSSATSAIGERIGNISDK
ncbi:MAG TPA: AAA family ATPase, partial [Clostridiales bacterium]|nr:AAA family ATPase [Clostridiales bacterium]